MYPCGEPIKKEKRPPREFAELYPCPCEKCKAKREADRVAKREATALEKVSGGAMCCGSMRDEAKNIKQEAEEQAKQEAAEEAEKLSPQDGFLMYMTEAVSLMAFGAISVSLIWIFVTRYTYDSAIRVYHSNRNVQLAVVLGFSFIFISAAVSYHSVSKQVAAKTSNDTGKAETAQNETKAENATPVKVDHSGDSISDSADSKIAASSGEANSAKVDSTESTKAKVIHLKSEPDDNINQEEEKKPSLFQRIFRGSCKQPVNEKNITVTITDSEAKEIFRQSKLFAIPTEMKHPPALLVYLHDVIMNTN